MTGRAEPLGGQSRRPRLLLAVTYGFSVRYLVPTGILELLRERADPVVGLGWDAPDLVAELDALGVETVRLPDAFLDHDFRRFRRQVDLIHQRRLRSPSTRIERRQRDALVADRSTRALGDLRRLRDEVAVGIPGRAARIEAQEPSMLDVGTNIAEFRNAIEQTAPDLVVSLTPYHEQDTLLLVAADRVGVTSLTSVISFDNPTTRRRFPTVSERILVWNRYNRDELLRSYPGLGPDRIGVIGAPQFDLHRRPELVLDETTWRRRMGLPASRPVILYGGGPSYLVPREPDLVREIDRMIDDGRIGGSPVLLVRRHPAEPPDAWKDLSSELRHGVVGDPWAPGQNPNRAWPTTADIEVQMSSMAHSSVHINVCSSMTLDGAMFDRPQVGPTFVPGLGRGPARRVRDLYEREHWLPITESGGLDTADTAHDLARAVDDALRDPSAGREGRRRMVHALIGTDDGRASERLIDEIMAAAGCSTNGSAVAGGAR